MRTVSIFGATGSIGQSTLEVLRARPKGSFGVDVLTGGRNIDQLARDAMAFGAATAVTCFPELYQPLKDRLSGSSVTAAAGPEALVAAAGRPADWTMSAIVGLDGLAPTLAALRRGGTVALANKESLVAAGPMVMATARDNGAALIPVDSEHSAVFQALRGEDPATVERVIITASGGAFRDWPVGKLADATPEQASSHPNWDMGQRITVDSASLFNKAMEVIETHAFFGIDPDRIEVLLHPQSLVHALVGFNDGALMAHIGPPDMRHAIGHAYDWPNRGHADVERLDLARIGRLDFADPDPARYPALGLAHRVMQAGGLAGALFTAAKDAALDAFLARRIGFTDMAGVVEAVLDRHLSEMSANLTDLSLDNIQKANEVARKAADEAVVKIKKG